MIYYQIYYWEVDQDPHDHQQETLRRKPVVIIINLSSSSKGIQEVLPIPPTVRRLGVAACNRCDRGL